MFYRRYADRDMDIQIRIDNLRNVHGGKYPLSWYEGKTDREIKGMHTAMMVRYAKTLAG